tara:strand:- start:28035 stop:28589 length:555 start_codon:yes stop_codon:yes gene_type:complete
MARKSFYNKHTSDQPEEQKLTPEQHRKCPAQDCPMMSSVFLEGGPWTCRYHAKQPKHVWPKVTERIIENKRWMNIVRVADALRADEYDLLVKQDAFELDELIKPIDGEIHAQWVARVKETIFKAMKHNLDKIAETNETVLRDTDKTGSKWAVNMLTNGALMKKPDFKSKKQQLEELQAKQERVA